MQHSVLTNNRSRNTVVPVRFPFAPIVLIVHTMIFLLNVDSLAHSTKRLTCSHSHEHGYHRRESVFTFQTTCVKSGIAFPRVRLGRSGRSLEANFSSCKHRGHGNEYTVESRSFHMSCFFFRSNLIID